MAEVVANNIVLADSLQRTRPGFRTFLLSDANANGNSVRQIEEKRRQRQMKFPSLAGRQDVDSFQRPPSDTPFFKKWNDEGDHRASAPYRSCDNILDPTSGFVSAAGDVDRNTGHTRIGSLVQLNTTPQAVAPQEINSVRVNTPAAPPPETCRVTERDPGVPYTWNGRKVLDASLRAKLGGWTSDKDPRLADKENSLSGKVHSIPDEAKELRDKLALQFMYRSSTQTGYEEVPWDGILAPRKWPPTSTKEERPDMVSQRYTIKKYDPNASEWQAVGRSWDWFQPRKGYYRSGPNSIVFCAPLPRAQQIPSYGGCIGGENLDEIDNAQEPFSPFTVKRVALPRYTDTAHRPNIPRYTGCTLYRSNTMPVHASQTPPEDTTHRRVHRSMPVTPNSSEHKRDSQMSKMVTLVPPCNPFNKVNYDGYTPPKSAPAKKQQEE